MAATDVLSAASPPWTTFEEYLDFQPSSPLNTTPRLAPASTPVAGTSSLTSSTSMINASAAPVVEDATTLNASSTPAPPPPGSSPEALFRHYLAIELRKIGSNADTATIDRYVAQHYSSFTRAMERQQAQQQQITSVHALDTPREAPQGSDMTALATANAFKSPPPMTSPSSAPYLLQGMTTVAPASIEASTSSAGLSQMTSMPQVSQTTSATIEPHLMSSEIQAQFSPQASSMATQSHRSEDAMSEDENDNDDEDESHDSLKGLSSVRRSMATEEVPIAGSIMGPANELRPDPETYRNLTSKEKRQLRNKISARNFRTRRKEHISHLEQQVADRDTLIEALRHQVAAVNLQNKELTDEVRQLKSKAISPADVQQLIEALQKAAVFGGAQSSGVGADGSLPAQAQQPLLVRTASSGSLTDAAASSRPMSPRLNGSVARPNTRKDVPATQAGAAGTSFWGGAVGGSAWPVNSSQAVA